MSPVSEVPEPVRRMHFTEPDEAAAAIRGLDVELSILAPRTTDWRLIEADLGESVLIAGRMGGAFSAMGATHPGVVTLSVLAQGEGWTLNGQRIGPETLACMPPGTEVASSAETSANWLTLLVPQERFEQRFPRAPGMASNPGDRSCTFVVDPERTGVLQKVLQATLRRLVERPALIHHPGARASMQKAVFAALGESLEAPASDGVPSHRSLLSNVRAYLDARRDDVVRVSELCSAVGHSERSLRHLFRAVFGASPGRYLRVRRLHQARRALRDRAAPARSVTEVGIALGFFDLGRFASDYRRMFGELPSTTLALARGLDAPA